MSAFLQKTLSRHRVRGSLAAVAGLLAVALWAPLWSTEMEAPQYRGEEALQVVVYADRVSGDLHEIETLNQYVGVHLPQDMAELRAAPWVIGLLLLLALAAVFLPRAGAYKTATALLVLMIATLLGGAALLQYRLYELGHRRSHAIVVGVPDFTPPLLGSRKIANFTVRTGLEYGGWAFLAAALLVGGVVYGGRRTRNADVPECFPCRNQEPVLEEKGIGS